MLVIEHDWLKPSFRSYVSAFSDSKLTANDGPVNVFMLGL